jgi:Leucine-rich repeat (LRR) protein
LEQLNLNDNQITSIDNGDFNGLSNLTSLSLQSNQITSIESGDFAGLSSLTVLDLTYNQITSIESGSFVGLGALIYLGLHTNCLDTDDSLVTSYLDTLPVIDYRIDYSNQLICLQVQYSTSTSMS